MYRNLLLVFFVSGFWHGAGWTFIVWGMMHGVVYVVTRLWKRRRGAVKAGTVKVTAGAKHILCVAFTFLFVNTAWVFFRAENIGQAVTLLRRMGTGGFMLPSQGIYEAFNLDEFWYVMKIAGLDRLPHADMLLCAVWLVTALGVVFFHKNAGEMEEKFQPKTANMLWTAVLFLWCVLSLSGVSTFLYFNF